MCYEKVSFPNYLDTCDKSASWRIQMNLAFNRLNETGQEEAAKRVQELTNIPTYQSDKDTWIGLVAKNRACSELALKMKHVIQAKAKEKQATSTGGINPQLLQISEKAEPIHTDEELSKLAGVSRDTV